MRTAIQSRPAPPPKCAYCQLEIRGEEPAIVKDHRQNWVYWLHDNCLDCLEGNYNGIPLAIVENLKRDKEV